MTPFSCRALMCLLAACFSAKADPLDVWQYRNPLPGANTLITAAYLQGQYLAVGFGPTLLSSPDGTNWVTHHVPGDAALTQIACGDGLYVAVGDQAGNGIILTSPNLDDWTLQWFGTSKGLHAVVYDGGQFVAGGLGGTLLTSTNGTNWVQRASGTTGNFGSIAYGNGVYVASDGEPAVFVSSDGVVWTRSILNCDTIQAVHFSRGLFHAGGGKLVTGPGYGYYGVIIFQSTDGTNWSTCTLPSDQGPISGLFADDNNYFALRYGPGLYLSSSGTNFTRMTVTNLNGAYQVIWGNGTFLGVGPGNAIQTSVNATNWTTLSQGPTPNLLDIACGKGVLVAVGGETGLTGLTPYSTIMVSSNGLPFQEVGSPVSRALSRILFADGLFHAVGISGTLLRSTNGVQWVPRNAGTTSHLWGLTRGDGLWVAVGNGGTISTSPNGQAWTLRFSGTSLSLYGVAYGNNIFVAVGYLGTVVTSSDGLVWTVQYNPSLDTLYDATCADGMFTAVGENGTIVTSSDGVNWEVQDSGVTGILKSVAFDHGTFLVVGGSPRMGSNESLPPVLLSSTNGLDWIRRNAWSPSALSGAHSLNGDFFCVANGGIILQNPSVGSLSLAGCWNSAQSQFNIILKLGLGQSFRLQSCEDLGAGTWIDRWSFTNAPNPLTVSDPSSALQPKRFYRAVGP